MPTYNSFFQNGRGTGALNEPNADVDGPILDFAICGFPKCGTTALMRSLAPITTMPPESDICTPIDNTVFYAYKTWPKKYGTTHQSTVVVVTTDNSTTTTTITTPKLLKGNKCPRYMETPDLTDFGSRLPKTRLIVGIRHPVKWFQSFFNQNTLWKKTTDYHAELRSLMIRSCSPEAHKKKKRGNYLYCDSHGCPDGQLACVARSRFHVSLSMMGKTPRNPDEVNLLNSEILQAKRRNNETTPLAKHNLDRRESLSSRQNNHSINAMDDPSITIPNHILLYESSQPQEEYFWQSLSEFIRINRTDLPTSENMAWTMGKGLNTNDTTKIEKMKEIQKAFDICDAKYDYLRQELMPIAYTLQQWLNLYFIPASKVRDDVTIPNVEKFEEIVEAYQRDPCNRLIRNQTDGEYYVDPKASLLSNQK